MIYDFASFVLVRYSELFSWNTIRPTCSGRNGTVQIDCGAGDIRKIALSKLVLGAQTYPANPAPPDFGANWVSPDVRAPYRSP